MPESLYKCEMYGISNSKKEAADAIKYKSVFVRIGGDMDAAIRRIDLCTAFGLCPDCHNLAVDSDARRFN